MLIHKGSSLKKILHSKSNNLSVHIKATRNAPPSFGRLGNNRLTGSIVSCNRIDHFVIPHRNIFSKIKSALSSTFSTNPPEEKKTVEEFNIDAPVASKVYSASDHHGRKYEDNYLYLKSIITDVNTKRRTETQKSAQKYLLEEDSYSKSIISSISTQYPRFYKEIGNRVIQVEGNLPERFGDYIYYMKQGKECPLYCRRKGENGKEEILLNGDKELNKYGFFHLLTMNVSKDQKYIGFIVDCEGHERYTLEIREASTGRRIGERIANVVNFEWHKSSEKFYYTLADDKHRPWKLVLRELSDPSKDITIKEENDERFYIDVMRTKDWNYSLITTNSKAMSEICLLENDTDYRVIFKRDLNYEFYIDHINGFFYIITNSESSEGYKLMRTTHENLSHKDQWELLLSGLNTFDADFYKDYIVLYEKHNGNSRIRVVDVNNMKAHFVKLPVDVCAIQPAANLAEVSNTFRFFVTSPFAPHQTYDYDMDTRELKLMDELKLSEEYPFDISLYEASMKQVKSGDVEVPMTLFHKKSIPLDGNNPTLVKVYGAYGTSKEVGFRPEYLSLLERGWVIAVAHVRGGGEKGKKWHKDGRHLLKKNSFDDFIACSNYLIENKYTNSEMMAAHTSSAGGLILGYVANNYPHLYKALIMDVPFVDVLTAMMDETLPLTVHEYDEWGNPKNKVDYDNIKSYDPYANIKRQDYPDILIKGSLIDIRCPIWQQLRYTAKLREYKTNKKMLILKIDHDYGHGGGNPDVGKADDLAFLYKSLNLVDNKDD